MSALKNKLRIIFAPKNAAGFTMVELMVSVSIVGVMLGIAVTNYGSWQAAMRLRSAARDLYSAMQTARLTAVRNNSNAAIVFNNEGNQYHLCSSPGADGLWDGDSDLEGSGDNEIIQSVQLGTTGNLGIGFGKGTADSSVGGGGIPADNVGYSDPDNVLVINSRGISANGEGYVYLENRYQETSYAVGTEASGLVKIWKWNGGSWQ